MVCILDLGGEAFNKMLEFEIYTGRDTFSGGNRGRDVVMAGVTRFIYLRK